LVISFAIPVSICMQIYLHVPVFFQPILSHPISLYQKRLCLYLYKDSKLHFLLASATKKKDQTCKVHGTKCKCTIMYHTTPNSPTTGTTHVLRSRSRSRSVVYTHTHTHTHCLHTCTSDMSQHFVRRERRRQTLLLLHCMAWRGLGLQVSGCTARLLRRGGCGRVVVVVA
jgi:hypothetical protein